MNPRSQLINLPPPGLDNRDIEGLFNQTFEFLGLLSPDGTLLEANQTSLKFVGMHKEEVIGHPFWETPWWTHSPESQATLREAIAQAATGEFVRCEVSHRSATGHIHTFDFSVTPLKDGSGTVIYLLPEGREISDRKQMELQLRSYQEELERQVQQRTQALTAANALLKQEISDRQQLLERSLLASREAEAARNQITAIWESITDGFIALSQDWRFIYINQRGAQILQRNREELVGQNVWEVFPEATHTAFYSQYHRVVAEQCTVEFEEFYAPLQSWFEVNAYPTPDGLVAYFQDITQRKQAEQKIREQAALLDIASDAIFVRDLEHRILYWNQGAERLYGWQSSEAIGQKANELLQEDTSQASNILQTVLDQGEWRGEIRKVTKTGQEVIVEGRWTLVRDEAGQPISILIVNTNITEKKQLEAQFLRAQRLESLGTLASGIAHDLNNILAPIMAIAPLLPLNLPPLSERSQQLLNMLDQNAKRGAELVKQILAFARGLGGERSPIQVKHLLREVEQIVRSTFPKSITITRSIATEDLWLVSADATQLHQVFMNFCVNARDAMPQGGTLSISAENFVIDETYAQMNLDAKVGSFVVITFADTGIGIPPEYIDRIFEPFFTTKAIGEGTGLGLSTVLGIVKNHGGFVTVSSKVGQGTTFQVFLPASSEIAMLPEEKLVPPSGEGELILVVDDEINIRETLKMTLENQNYQVLTAKDGIEAIATYALHQDEIKAVLIDLMMPSMDGVATIQTLQQFHPQIKIIACSGVPTREQLLNSTNIKTFLAKPFSSEKLLNTLHKMLKEEAIEPGM